MPFPLLLLVPVAAKAAVLLKSTIVAAKGAAVIGKVITSKAALAKGATVAAKTYGWGNVIAASAVATLSVGAATLVYERAQNLKRAIDRQDINGSVVAASGLLGEIGGHAGLDGASQVLRDFMDVGGSDITVVERTSLMLNNLIQVISQKIG